jgi:hypothetical protein
MIHTYQNILKLLNINIHSCEPLDVMLMWNGWTSPSILDMFALESIKLVGPEKNVRNVHLERVERSFGKFETHQNQ